MEPQVSAADFTPKRIAELRQWKDADDGRDWEFWAALDAIEELQAALLATIKITPVVQPKTEADFTPEKLAEIAADLTGWEKHRIRAEMAAEIIEQSTPPRN
jgi:hypothetical protein